MLVSWLAAIGLVLWAVSRVDLTDVGAGLRVSYPGWLAAALLSVVAGVGLRVARWRLLLSIQAGRQPAWAALWRATLWGQAINMVFPFRAGDLARACGLERVESVGAAYALGTIAAEKLLDLAGLSLAAVLIFLLSAHAPWGDGLAALAALLPIARLGLPLLLLGGALGVAWFLSRRPLRALGGPPAWRHRLGRGMQRLAAGLAVLSRPAVLAAALAWSLPLWLAHVFNNYAAARALALPLDWPAALLVWVVLQIGLTPASTPARIGVFQALCVAGLVLLGYSPALGLAYGLLLQVVVMLPPLALLLLDLAWERRP
jgi:uncharacterized membrane protein YbhN (UPF0104 family)